MWNSTRNTELLLFCVCVCVCLCVCSEGGQYCPSEWEESQWWRFRNWARGRRSAAARSAQTSRCLMCCVGARRKWFSLFVVWFGVHDGPLWHMRKVRLENRSQIWKACTWFSTHLANTTGKTKKNPSVSFFFFLTDLRHFQVCEMTGVDRKQPVCEPESARHPAGETSQPRSCFSKSETVCPRF